MNIQEALNVFGLSGELTEKDIKAAYKKAALKYHPDRNPLGAELMKAVNAAFDTHKETLKEIGCKWAPKKKQWFYRPDEHKSYWNREEHTIEEIRAKYGTTGQRKATGWQRVETRA